LKPLIASVKRKLSNHKTLVANFGYLSVLQIFNLILPLVTYPYLIRVLGKETYGLVVFAQAIINYLLILVTFGFNISATKEVSIHRNNKEKLNEIISSIFIIKGLLFLFSLIILFILLHYIKEAKGYELLFLLSLYICLSDIIFPTWYFQGIEKMKYITIINLLSRLVFVSLIFILIHKPGDYLIVPIIYGIGTIISGISSLYIIFAKHNIRFKMQSITTLKRYIRNTLPMFISNISDMLYVNSNKVVIGAFLGMGEVAIMDLAEKVMIILKIPQTLLNQTLFPKINKDKNINFIKKAFLLALGLNLLIFFSIQLFAPIVVKLLGGIHLLPAVGAIRILAIALPIVAMNNIFGIHTLIPFGHNKEFAGAFLSSGVAYLLVVFILWITNSFSIYTLSASSVLVEILVTSILFFFCQKHQLLKPKTIV